MDKLLRFDDPWKSMTWEGAADANLIAGANLTLSEKLAWLEEINDLARNLKPSRPPTGAREPAAPAGERDGDD